MTHRCQNCYIRVLPGFVATLRRLAQRPALCPRQRPASRAPVAIVSARPDAEPATSMMSRSFRCPFQRFIHQSGSKSISRRGIRLAGSSKGGNRMSAGPVFLALTLMVLVIEVKIVIKIIFRKRYGTGRPTLGDTWAHDRVHNDLGLLTGRTPRAARGPVRRCRTACSTVENPR